jgi:hypothetical protein
MQGILPMKSIDFLLTRPYLVYDMAAMQRQLGAES